MLGDTQLERVLGEEKVLKEKSMPIYLILILCDIGPLKKNEDSKKLLSINVFILGLMKSGKLLKK